jgi:hypothetical protein
VTDRALIDDFLRRALSNPNDIQPFWSDFVQSLITSLKSLPDYDRHTILKQQIAACWLYVFINVFCSYSTETFYWQPGELPQAVYQLALQFGLQILPVHPYSPAPDPRQLPPNFFTNSSALPGLKINLENSARLLRTFAANFRDEYEALPSTRLPNSPPWTYFLSNGFYDGLDGQILYAMIRHFRPRRIVEIGSGNSTYLSAQAIARNCKYDPSYSCELTAIEPCPNPVLQAGFPGLTRLIPSVVQDVPLALFEGLTSGDILFIDSSHVVRTGSDVCYEILEILPQLREGVIIHFHDIFLPCEYPRQWVQEMNRYWTEQYLLQAFLAFNRSFDILIPAAFIHTIAPDLLAECFRNYDRHGPWVPSNFWIQKHA